MSLSFDFSDDQNMMRDAIQTFCKEEIAPLVEEAEEKQEFPSQLFPKMAEMGFLGICFEEKYGGLGLDKVTQCILAEELGKTCAGIAKGVAAHVDLGSLPVAKFGTEEQKQKYLVPSIAGKETFGAESPTFNLDIQIRFWISVKTSVSGRSRIFILRIIQIYATV